MAEQTTHCPDGYRTCAVHNARPCDRGGQCKAHLAPPPAVPDPSFRDQAAQLLWPFGVPHRMGHEDRERWERVTAALAVVEARVQAAANQRAAQAWTEGKLAALGVSGDVGRNPYRAAPAQPAPGATT